MIRPFLRGRRPPEVVSPGLRVARSCGWRVDPSSRTNRCRMLPVGMPDPPRQVISISASRIETVPSTSDPVEAISRRRHDLERLERETQIARENLRAAVYAVGEALRNDADRATGVIAQLYWNEPRVSAQWIARAFELNQHELRAVAGPGETGCTCRSCGRSITVRSRSAVARPGDYCENCRTSQPRRNATRHDSPASASAVQRRISPSTQVDA